MKKILLVILFLCVSVLSVFSVTVTNINAVYRYGQVFVTWDNDSAYLYILYRSVTPIIHGNQLQYAQNLGRVNNTSAYNKHLGAYLRIDSASPPLPSTKGLFVATSTSNGSFYYAVTTISSGVEDTAIITGSNSLSSPVNETVSNPKPVWQLDTLIAPKQFDVYVWFATKVTSTNFPKMTNAGTYPFNFAIVRQGNQSPHPVTYWMRPSGMTFVGSHVWGTGDPNEWIISIDDYNPNPYDGTYTMYYGYHENYDIYSINPNPIPDTGTIYNYTAAMVNLTVNWTLSNFPLDSTRTCMTGWSMGAIGSIFNSLMMPSKIAAIFIYAPVFNLAAWGVSIPPRLWGTYQTNLFTNEGMRRNERLNVNYLASINRLNSLPIIYSFCGKNDVTVGWPEKIAFYDSMNVLKHGGFHFWSMNTHQEVIGSNPWRIAAYPPSFTFFTRYRTDLSYPAYSNCSHNHNPGNGTPTNGDSLGQINGHLDWNDDIIDSLYKWQITLKTKTLITIYDTLFAPDSCTADVTLRRLQRFNPIIGNTIEWSNTRNNVIVQQGSFIYNGGLITIPNVKIYEATNTLKLINIPIGITKNSNSIPLRFQLYQNYPNPFNPVTKIKFDLPKSSYTKVSIYDVLGREIAILINEQLKPGTYEIDWDASYFSSGVYFYKLTAGDFSETKKMILIK